jgi:AAA domain
MHFIIFDCIMQSKMRRQGRHLAGHRASRQTSRLITAQAHPRGTAEGVTTAAHCGKPFPCPSSAGPGLTQDPRAATLVLMVGLPAAGNTTRAKELAATHQGLRLTPDHWMIPLFGDPRAGGKRWVLEGRLISVALQALRLGTSVVLDYGLWGRDERSALRWLARSAGQRAR